MAGLYANSPSDFNTPTFDARYSTLPSQRDSMAVGLQTGAKPLADAASVATSSWKAFENYILGKGATALEKGIAELKEAGQLNPEMEATFRAIDPNDREQLGKALSSMAQIRSNWTSDKQAMEFAQNNGKSELALAIKAVEDRYNLSIEEAKKNGDNAKVIQLEEARERAKQKAMKQSKENTRTAAMYNLENPAYTAFKSRFGESKDEKDAASLTASGQRTKWEQRKYILNVLRPKDVLPVVATLEKTTPIIQDKMDVKNWGSISNQNDAFLKVGNFISTQMDTIRKNLDTTDRSIWARGITWLADKLQISEKDGKTMKLSEEERAKMNSLNSAITMMMSDFIRSKSGLTVTDNEREILMNALNLTNYSTAEEFRSSYNSVVGQLQGFFESEEDMARQADQDIFDEISLGLTKGLPSQRVAKTVLKPFVEEGYTEPDADAPRVEAEDMKGLTKGKDGYYTDAAGKKWRWDSKEGKKSVKPANTNPNKNKDAKTDAIPNPFARKV